MTRIIGAHTVDKGGIHMAALRAGATGMQALQLFTAIPKYYGDKTSIRPERVQRFREALARAKIEPANVLVHAAYVLNTATADDEKWLRAAAGLRKELERSTAIGAGALCFHPGAATDGDREGSLARVAVAITGALEAVTGQDQGADREHRGRGDDGREDAGGDRGHARRRAGRAARPHGLRPRHLPSVLGRTRYHRVGRRILRRSSIGSRPPPAWPRRSSISTTAKAPSAATGTATC